MNAVGTVETVVIGQVMYATLWKPSGIAPVIEQATSAARRMLRPPSTAEEPDRG